jgi:cytochrome bd-type quinol oxidase subunit 1
MSSKSKAAEFVRTVLAAVVLCLIAVAGVGRLAQAGNRRPKFLWKSAVGSWVYALAVAPTVLSTPAQ